MCRSGRREAIRLTPAPMRRRAVSGMGAAAIRRQSGRRETAGCVVFSWLAVASAVV
jgi:hypothetical protein